MSHADQGGGFAPIFETARECGFASFDLERISIKAALDFLKRNGLLITTTSLSINTSTQHQSPVTTLSGLYGDGCFPYHSDYSFVVVPPRFIILTNESSRCFARRTFIATFESIPQDIITILQAAQWLLTSRHGAFLLSSIQLTSLGTIFRWDTDFLTPYNQAARQSILFLPSYFERVKDVFEWQQRSALLIDNWRCVHARGGMVSGDDDMIRHLNRYEVWTHARLV